MTATANTQELLALEKRFWNALKERDAQSARQMTDDGCIVVGAQGVSAINSAAMAKMTEEAPWELERFSFDDGRAQVRFIHDDVALVAYPVNERVLVDGKTLDIEANDASVWVKRNGDWVCAMHTESLAGDPYGRDRVAPVTGSPSRPVQSG